MTRVAATRSAASRLLVDRTSTCVAFGALFVAAIHPPHGLGARVGWVDYCLGIPCWGCGLSRSLSCSARGMLAEAAEAWSYHPFGPFVLLLFAAIVLVRLLPGPRRRRLLEALDGHPRPVHSGYTLFVASFVLFGSARRIAHALS